MPSEQQVAAQFSPSFDRDLENARVLIEESPWKDNPQKYRKVAEAIVRRVLGFDPSNEAAKRLLEKIEKPIEAPVQAVAEPVAPPAMKTQPEPGPVPPPKPQPKTPIETLVQAIAEPAAPPAMKTQPDLAPAPPPPPQPLPAPAKVVELTAAEPAPRRPVAQPDVTRPVAQPALTFTVGSSRPATKSKARRPPWIPIACAGVGAIAGLALLVSNRSTFTKPYSAKTSVAAPTVAQASTTVTAHEPAASPAPATAAPEQPAAISPVVPPPAPDPAPAKTQPPATPPAVVVKSNVAPVAPLETGTLAVSSPTTVDIYLNDQLVGSAPTTLVLPVGNQTLEFRHQDLRKVMTHTIKMNETTTAMVTFDVTVQINARPWAQVSIDGSKRQPLGQTPLSDARVPIGSNLIFENPNFPAKSYRVTGKETQIRVSFP